MRRLAAVLALFVLSSVWVSSIRADDERKFEKDAPVPKIVPLPGSITPDVEAVKKAEIPLNPELAALIAPHGFTLDKTGTFTHASKGETPRITLITPEMLKRAHFDFDEEGRLIFMNPSQGSEPGAKKLEGIPVKESKIVGTLNGLLSFAEVAKGDPKEIGKKLQAWGVPIAYDGIHLINPDGSATYYGMMLHEGLMKGPKGNRALRGSELNKRLKSLTGRRLSQAVNLFEKAFNSTFKRSGLSASRPKLGEADIGLAFKILDKDPGKGEVALKLESYTNVGEQFANYRTGLEAKLAKGGDEKSIAALKRHIATLNKLEKTRYYKRMDLTAMVPSPGEEKKSSKEEPGLPPRHKFLPSLLAALDKLTGKRLSAKQQEALIKSFPMGETIWRIGAQNLWRHGLTGKGVKVAVIDSGVGMNAELEGVVKKRDDFTNQEGFSSMGEHGTHVAGVVHAIAPDAEIRSYAVTVAAYHKEKRLEDSPGSDASSTRRVMEAIDRAVADGNHIIQMSLRWFSNPSSALTKRIEKYANTGVIFIISAGNEAGRFGVGSPANAKNAITVGALDPENKMTDFSTYGAVTNGERVEHVVKTIFMMPGSNMVAPTALSGEDPKYQRWDGTSMASPPLSGVFALFAGYVMDLNSRANPVTLAGRMSLSVADRKKIEGAILTTADAMDERDFSRGVPVTQPVLIVNPLKAYQKLRPAG